MKRTTSAWIACLSLVVVVACQPPRGGGAEPAGKWSAYTGRFVLNPDLVFVVSVRDSLLTLLPSYWRTALILDPKGSDEFASLLHPEFQFRFLRDSVDQVTAVEVSGHDRIGGRARLQSDDEYQAVELLLAGQGTAALDKLGSEGALNDPQRAISLGFGLIANFPSRAVAGAELLSGLESKFPESSDLHEAIGHAWMLSGERGKATEAFERAARIDPGNAFLQRALRHLESGLATPPSADAWKVPFDLDSLFAAPTPAEIEAVRRDWAGRGLEATEVEEVAEHSIMLQGQPFIARVLTHSVHGDRHYGAVLIPEGAVEGCCPVILELHGVSHDYPPFDVESARIPPILQQDLSRVIVALPAFRGTTLTIGDHSYLSEGTPHRAWDGAADDALAFLNVVIDRVPEIEGPPRVCAFGKSRGGTVAMLVAERDSRIDCVVNWAGPAEWFGHMGTFGWTLQEQVEWALWERWGPGGGWGSSDQFVDWYLSDPIAQGSPGLRETRLRVLASSPLYFLESLPAAEMHYGVEDRSVPIANAEALQRAHDALTPSSVPFVIHFQEGAGHDMPYPRSHQASREFLLRRLFAR